MTTLPSAPSTLVTSEYFFLKSPNCTLISPISFITVPLVNSSSLFFIFSIFFKVSLISETSLFTSFRPSVNPSCSFSISICFSIICLISIFNVTKILSHFVHRNLTPRHTAPEVAFFNSPYNELVTLPHFICTHFLHISQSTALSADLTSSLHSAHLSKANPPIPSSDVVISPTTPLPPLICKTSKDKENPTAFPLLSGFSPLRSVYVLLCSGRFVSPSLLTCRITCQTCLLLPSPFHRDLPTTLQKQRAETACNVRTGSSCRFPQIPPFNDREKTNSV